MKNFEQMWDAYPNPGGTSAEAKKTIGGAVDADWIQNTCVIRLSRSLNESGNPIPKRAGDEIATLRGGDGKHYAYRVKELTRYLKRRYGKPTLVHDYPGGAGGEVPPAFRGRQGVICFEVDGWSDATGHYDLWNGARCRHSAYFERAKRVMLWEVPSNDAPSLGGSVGEGGHNDPADVKLVKRLLVARGLAPGPINGTCTPQTIAAIRELQARFLARPDGRVDPGGRTWRELNALG